MREWIALVLHRLASAIYNDERAELVVVLDEYGICRCRVEVAGDASHGITAEFDELPEGWVAEWRAE